MSLKETDRGKRGRGVAGKKMSFWSFEKRRKSIYSKLFFPNCSKEALMPIRPRTANAIYHKYRRLESLWWTHFEWIWTPLKSFTVKMNLVWGNDIWHWKFDVSFAKRRLAKFNGCTSEAFVLPLEQDEFTNHRSDEKL